MCYIFDTMKNKNPIPFSAVLITAWCLFSLPKSSHAEERMNAMVGLWYSTYNNLGFEYDLIAQFQKSKEWMGNISGIYLGDEVYQHANRFCLGLVLGQRVNEKGTFAVNLDGFGENRYNDFSQFHWGIQSKVTIAIFGLKVGLIDQETFFLEAGLSY